MFEISRIAFILMLEGLVLFACTTFLLASLIVVRKRRRHRAIKQLAEQILHQSKLRRDQTGSYLQAIYHFEDEQLSAAIDDIEKQEKRFFQHLIDVIYTEDNEQIVALDAALAGLIDTYKSLRPRELVKVETDQDLLAETEALKEENVRLQSELEITRTTMSDMVAEFGNMFGGGSDHELAKHEVVEKIIDQDSKEKADAEKIVDQVGKQESDAEKIVDQDGRAKADARNSSVA